METLENIQAKTIRHGPIIARVMKKPARFCVRQLVYRWGSLTAGPAESKWAADKIYQEVSGAYPILMSWLIKILVTAIINWFLKRRSRGLDMVLKRLRREML